MSPAMAPLDPLPVPNPPTSVMSGRCSLALGLLMNATPAAAPSPTAGSVITVPIGMNPNLVSRNPLMSNHPSSDVNVDDVVAGACGAGEVVCANATDACSTNQSVTAHEACAHWGKRAMASMIRRLAVSECPPVQAWCEAARARPRLRLLAP